MSFAGHRHTEETRLRMSRAKLGNTNANEYSRRPETKAKVAAMLKGKPGRATGWSKPGLEATTHPTTLDIAWAAGIFEGEGWSSSTSGGRPTTHAAVGQKERWLPDRLKALFGGSVYLSARTGVIHQWHVHGSRARGFLMTVYKFLSPRRQAQVKKVLGDTISLEQT